MNFAANDINSTMRWSWSGIVSWTVFVNENFDPILLFLSVRAVKFSNYYLMQTDEWNGLWLIRLGHVLVVFIDGKAVIRVRFRINQTNYILRFSNDLGHLLQTEYVLYIKHLSRQNINHLQNYSKKVIYYGIGCFFAMPTFWYLIFMR